MFLSHPETELGKETNALKKTVQRQKEKEYSQLK
jgi:hypothetical protein